MSQRIIAFLPEIPINMPKKSTSQISQTEKELAKEVKELSKEICKLKDMEYMKIFKNPWKFMWFSFLKGLMVGFGSILGASVLVGVFVYILAQISLVPVVGDFVEKILTQIQVNQLSPNDADKNSPFFDETPSQ